MAVQPLAVDIPASILRDVIQLRRDIHAHPELGFEEVRTSAIVADELRKLDYDVCTGIAQTGVVGILRTGRPGRTVLLRADMDALPIEEQSGVPFASVATGKMHACGHDAHVAILLGAARLVRQRRDECCGMVVFCFQPAEEGKGGGRAMVEQGVLEDPHVDAVYGLHVWSRLTPGVVAVRGGPIMASSDSIEITIRGKGGHGAAPHETVDAIVTSAHFITAVQSVVSRTIDPLQPAVITIGSIHSGTTHNVIPDEARLLGTVRAFDSGVRDEMPARIEGVLRGCCGAAGASYDFRYERRYPVTVNDAAESQYVRELAARTLGASNSIDLTPIMGAEDFSFMLEQRPGCFFFLGAGPGPEAEPHHSARFKIDEAALENGVKMMTALALDAPRRPLER